MFLTRYSAYAVLLGLGGIALIGWTEGAVETLPFVVTTLVAMWLTRSFYRLGA